MTFFFSLGTRLLFCVSVALFPLIFHCVTLTEIHLFYFVLLFSHLKKFYIGVQLIYNVVLVSGVQQSDSVIHIHVSILFSDSFPI